MKTRIRKGGEGLIVEIPEAFAAEAGLIIDATVDLKLVEGKVVIESEAADRFDFDELVNRITVENTHQEHDSGPSCGVESW